MQTIQSLFYRTIEFVNSVPHRRVGRPAKELQESCRPWLFQSAPGSYQFSVAIQKPTQLDFFRQDVEPERIAQHFLEIVSASSGNDTAELARLVPDESNRIRVPGRATQRDVRLGDADLRVTAIRDRRWQ